MNINNLDHMCDGCYRTLAEDEQLFGFVLVDSNGAKKPIKGHKGCVQDIAEMINQIYGNNGVRKE